MKNIIETAGQNANFSTLVSAITAAGLTDTLSAAGPFTVFAPTNDAFAKIPKDTLDTLLANKEKLAGILTYHVVAGKLPAKQVSEQTKVTTVQGADLTVKTSQPNTGTGSSDKNKQTDGPQSKDSVKINDATITTADIMCTNGVIHAIDTVLMPKN